MGHKGPGGWQPWLPRWLDAVVGPVGWDQRADWQQATRKLQCRAEVGHVASRRRMPKTGLSCNRQQSQACSQTQASLPLVSESRRPTTAAPAAAHRPRRPRRCPPQPRASPPAPRPSSAGPAGSGTPSCVSRTPSSVASAPALLPLRSSHSAPQAQSAAGRCPTTQMRHQGSFCVLCLRATAVGSRTQRSGAASAGLGESFAPCRLPYDCCLVPRSSLVRRRCPVSRLVPSRQQPAATSGSAGDSGLRFQRAVHQTPRRA